LFSMGNAKMIIIAKIKANNMLKSEIIKLTNKILWKLYINLNKLNKIISLLIQEII